MVIPIPPHHDFVGGDFDETPVGVFVVTEIPFVFMIEIFGHFVGGLAVGGVGFAFDDEDGGGIGQGEGHILVADEVGVFLGVGSGGDVDFALRPDEPDGNEVRPPVIAHGGEPDGIFTAQAGI